MNKIAAMEVFRHHGWLARMPAPFREQVLAQSDLMRLKADEAVYGVGDETGGLYGVASGCVGLHLSGADGERTLTHLGQAGFWFGDAAAIGKHKRLITVVAMVGTELLRLPRAAMLRIAAADPDAWLHFAGLLSSNVARSFALISVLRRDDPVERIGALLLSLAGEPGHYQPRVPGSQADLGAMANLGRSTVNSALAELAARGLIRSGYGRTEIISRTALQDFVGLAADTAA